MSSLIKLCSVTSSQKLLAQAPEEGEDRDDDGHEAASEASDGPVNELYDDDGVLMCQLEAFIDLCSMPGGA